MTRSTKTRRSNKERRQDSDQRIINAALELFAAQGYLRTTLIQIGNIAGYTGTLVSNRFKSKEGLLRAVLAHIMQRFEDAPEKQGFKSAQAQMSDFLELYLKDVADREDRIRALHVIIGEALGAIPEIRDEVISVYTIFRGRVAGLVQAGIESGDYKADTDPDQASIIIVGMLRGITMQYLADPKAVDPKAMIPVVQRNVLAGLTGA